MMRNKNPEQEHSPKDMCAHGMTYRGRVSFAEKCCKLLQEHADSWSKVNTKKNFKSESQQKYRIKHYRIQRQKDVKHKQIKMGWSSKLFPKIKVASGRTKI